MFKERNVVYLDKYYGPLLDSYTKSILNSGILLDEDLEVLYDEYGFNNSYTEPKKYRYIYGIIAGITSIFASALLMKKYKFLLLASSAVTIGIIFAEIRAYKLKARRKELLNKLVNGIRNKNKLNWSIMRYLKFRMDVVNTKNNTHLVFSNRKIKEFLKLLYNHEVDYFQCLLNKLHYLSTFSNDLSEDYQHCKQISSFDQIKEDNDDIENNLNYIKILNDIHIWLNSKLLSYLGVIFCSKTSKLNKQNLEHLLNIYLPDIIHYIETHHGYVKNIFLTLKNTTTKYFEYKTKTNPKYISIKLQESLVDVINNASIMSEKLEVLLEKLNTTSTNSNPEWIHELLDIKNHSLAVYESIDLLNRLYGLVSNSQKVKQEADQITTFITDKITEDKLPVMIRYNDNIEPCEENYEIYIDKNHKDNLKESCDACSDYDDNSSGYSSLMLQELKQSIKKHQRFQEAKKRRGSRDSETDESKETTDEQQETNRQPTPPQLPNKEFSSPPSPPPLPHFSVENFDMPHFNTKSMLDKIVALSNQRDVKEEVFVISESDSD